MKRQIGLWKEHGLRGVRKSIRIRFSVIFIGLMATILLGIWAMNNWMLEGFYINQKVNALELAYSEVNKLVTEKLAQGEYISDDFINGVDNEDEKQARTLELLRSLSDKYNITMLIVDSFNNMPLVASNRDINFMMDRVFQYMLGRSNPRTEILMENEDYTVQKTFDPRSKSF